MALFFAIFVVNSHLKMAQFVHLHLHTQYSVLDGAASVKSIIDRAVELGMGAVAITDHGYMYGVLEFYNEARKAGIKPIIGCETYVVRNNREKDKDEKAGDHLILLAKNETGYHNLLRLVSDAATSGFYYKPRTDKERLRTFSEGLICASACLGGELPQAIMKGNIPLAESIIEEYKSIFGDDYYIELQLHKPRAGEAPIGDVYERQMEVNPVLVELAQKHGVGLIATNDVHFTREEDAEAHDHLICLNTKHQLSDIGRMRYSGREYFTSAEEMAALFPEYPEALENTVAIAAKVEEYKLSHAPLMPNFEIPSTFTIDETKLSETFLRRFDYESTDKKTDNTADKALAESASSIETFAAQKEKWREWLTISKQCVYLEYLAYEGAKERYGTLDEKITERLDYELRTIERMGYPGYFLIVSDFIAAARAMDVSVGPGRGSAAGSVVAYCLKITNIDPLKYDLLFERFLNPDRISMPDIDIDFDEDGRSNVLRYVADKYGEKRVAQIVTFGTMATKSAIKDVARVKGLEVAEGNRLSKLVPDGVSVSFKKAYQDSPELRSEKANGSPITQNTLAIAERLEGSIRQTGVHACGVIIAPDDIEYFAPVAQIKDEESSVVQFEGTLVESIGLIKMDFLGLRTLSIIKDTLVNIRRNKGIEIDIDAIPLDDEATYKLFCNGETTGIFQFESAGMRKYLRQLKPSRLEDLIAMNALYRPGPMENIPSFIERKHGREKIVYDFPEMEVYLADTYGITVYQEQVMLLSQLIAGFSGGEADTLRKAMGKKIRKMLDEMKPKFLDGAVARGHDATTCEKIWSDWEAFASYAFNKSHSTCYAYIAYQTAYLKAHYPAEFMAALLSRNLNNTAELGFFMEESRRMKIPVLGADVNESYEHFTADTKGNIRYGLAGIKGAGVGAAEAIIKEREQNGKFADIYDFAVRMSGVANKRILESLVCAGAFDNITDFHRSRFLVPDSRGVVFIDTLINYGNRVKAEQGMAQMSLFGDAASGNDIAKPQPPDVQEWSKIETLNREREMTGISLSSHVLDDHRALINKLCTHTLPQLDTPDELADRDFTVVGTIIAVDHKFTKTGKPWGRFTLEDYAGKHEFALFGKDYEEWRKFLYPDYQLLLRGKVERRKVFHKRVDGNFVEDSQTRAKREREQPYEARIMVMMQLDQAEKELVGGISITLPIEIINNDFVEQLSAQIKQAEGDKRLKIRIVSDEGVGLQMFSRTLSVALTQEFTDFLNREEIEYKFEVNR